MKLTPQQLAQYSSTDFLYDQFPTGLLSFQADGRIISANQTMADWTGIPIPELLLTEFRKLLDHPSMLYYDMIIAPQLSLNGIANEYSVKFHGKDGTYDALLNVKTYQDENGEGIILIASVQKIINRKKYETELRLETRTAEGQAKLAQLEKRHFEFLFNSFPNSCWTITPKGQVSNMNSKAINVFNGIEGSNSSVFRAIYPSDRRRTIRLWRRCRNQGRKFEKELRLVNESSHVEWHLVTAEPYYNQQQEIELWFCSMTNIHHQKLLQLANQHDLKSHLSSAYRDLDQKKDLLVEIASDQSHMVRKPLANIIGLTELLQLDSGQADPHILGLLMQSAVELDEMLRKISSKTAL
ncbi:MAG: PAS domain-containing protein [Pedobacter sp.]|nr:MAG: PAS domain-containing protein [Pedobacter sp.]